MPPAYQSSPRIVAIDCINSITSNIASVYISMTHPLPRQTQLLHWTDEMVVSLFLTLDPIVRYG